MTDFYRSLLQALFPRGLNRDVLKIIILVSMTVDHIAYMFPVDLDAYMLMRTFGKLTAPLVALFIAEGFVHTRSRPDYFLRLAVFAAVSQIPFRLAFGSEAELNVMFTLALSVLFLMVWEAPRLGPWQKLLASILILAACSVGDWKYYMPAMVYLHYTRRFKFSYLLPLVLMVMWEYGRGGVLFWPVLLMFLGLLLALPVVQVYNGQKGSGKHKSFFYWYYPVHLLILFFLRILLFPAY